MKIKIYQKLYHAIKLGDNDDIRTRYYIVNALTNKPIHELKKMKWIDFQKLEKETKVPDMPTLPDAFVKQFECEGEKFYVNQYITDWNTEQMISMSTLTKGNEAIIDNIHSILATLCYKEKDEDISMTEFNRRAEMFREHLEVDIAYPIGFFFALLSAKLSEVTQSYSIKKKKPKKPKRIGLLLNGVGMQRLTSYLRKKIGRSLTTTLK